MRNQLHLQSSSRASRSRSLVFGRAKVVASSAIASFAPAACCLCCNSAALGFSRRFTNNSSQNRVICGSTQVTLLPLSVALGFKFVWREKIRKIWLTKVVQLEPRFQEVLQSLPRELPPVPEYRDLLARKIYEFLDTSSSQPISCCQPHVRAHERALHRWQ